MFYCKILFFNMIILDFEYSASTSYVTKDPDCCQWKNVSGNFLLNVYRI